MKTLRTILLLGLAGGLALGSGSRAKAAERTTLETAPSALTGKVVAVDKAKRSITVDIKGRIFVFKLSPKLTVRQNNQVVSSTSLSPGQTIGLSAQRNPAGSFEIVALDIQPNEELVVAGNRSVRPAKGTSKQSNASMPSQGFTVPVPFRTEPNPANLSGGDVSPH